MNHSFNRIVHRLHTFLGAWPGLLTGALLIVLLAGALLFLTHSSPQVSAKDTSPSLLAAMATRSARGSAAIAATTTPQSPTPMATLTPTATPSPYIAATQVADSPLVVETGAALQAPLPGGLSGPALAPVAMNPIQTITASQELSATEASEPTPALEGAVKNTSSLLPTVTPTPTATQSIIEALEQPIAPGGIAAIVASATAVAPPVAQTPTEFPTVTEAELTSAPLPDGVSDNAPSADVTAPDVTAPDATGSEVAPPIATAASQPTPDGNGRTAYVPILMYHYLSVPPADADAIRLDLSVTPDLFAAHLDAMQQAGYTTISLYTLLDNLTHGAPLPEKPVVISFDDGYRDNYTNALPILRDHNMIATFFIVPDFIDNQRPEYLTWDMVREMYAAGMSIEGHGRNHVSLAHKDHDYLVWQALGSYEAIEREVGVRPHFLAYPAGEYDQATIDMLRSADFWAAATTQQGATHRSDDLFELKRVGVHGTTTPEQLLNLLSLDW